ncbi:MAG: TatD family hydrolase [Armatimonadota bacterium]
MDLPGLVDSHIHLTDFDSGMDIAALVREAAVVGVSHMVCNGTSESDWAAVLAVAGECPGVIPCFGLHPWFVTRRSGEWLSVLEGFVKSNNCGVGEIGLDRWTEPFDQSAYTEQSCARRQNCACEQDNSLVETDRQPPLGGQEEAFRAQLDLARKYDRPAMVHCVRSWGWLMDVLRDVSELPRRLLIHAYGGSTDLIRPLADIGAYFSFSATVLNDNFRRARSALMAVPPERLLVETDAPNMLPPERCGGDLNHPANLPAIADGIADLLGESHKSLRERLWRNSHEFLGDLILL